MHATVLDRPTSRGRLGVLLGVLLSIAAHAVVAGGMSTLDPPVREKATWMEMVVVTPPPPPPPVQPELPPPPPPEPPKARPKEVVKFEDTSPVPPSPSNVPPPPNAKKVTRMVQGLSNNSFVEGPGQSSFAVRAGNTTATAYRPGEVAAPSDGSAQGVVPYQSVAVAPKLMAAPLLPVPPELKEAGITGKVAVELTISEEGKVDDVRVLQKLHPAADEACARDLRRLTRWKPALRDGSPVTVTGVPFTCRYEVLEP